MIFSGVILEYRGHCRSLAILQYVLMLSKVYKLFSAVLAAQTLGDFVLQQAARIMEEETRNDDLVARIGGDEFVIVIKGSINQNVLASIAERLIQRLQQPKDFENETCRVSASIGIAMSTQFSDLEKEGLLNAADQALYQAKRMGRSRYCFFRWPSVRTHG